MFLPAGPQVSAVTARLLQSDLEELSSSTIKPYIDFDHSGKAAAADPKRFIWKPGQGVFLRLAWTRSGRAAVEGKDYRYFSAALRVDDKGEIAGLPANGAIGALVNKQPAEPGLDTSRSHKFVTPPKTGLSSTSACLASQAELVSGLKADSVLPNGMTSSEMTKDYAKMRAQRKVLAAFRKAHPKMSTDEVFRSLTQQTHHS